MRHFDRKENEKENTAGKEGSDSIIKSFKKMQTLQGYGE